jgi:glucosyl-dolichyl phosphate glucuronosyltransferase
MSHPPASVVIPCHSERGWDELVLAARSVLAQRPAPVKVVVAVDHNEALFERATREIDGVVVVRNELPRGASGNRNSGIRHTDTELVALLDGDTYAHPGWLSGLLEPFSDPDVVGSGGAIRPDWGSRPRWFPDEFLWVVGASYAGLPTSRSPVRNVWSGSMAVRREVFDAVDGFRTDFGKVGDRSRPEDTDLCLRMSEASGGHWVYVPDAVIDHPVSPERSTLRFFLARCCNEGRAKVEMARLYPGRPSLGAEHGYMRSLPRAAFAGLADTLRGRGAARAAQSAAVAIGAVAAGVGAAVGLLSPVSPARRARPVPAQRPAPVAGPQRIQEELPQE